MNTIDELVSRYGDAVVQDALTKIHVDAVITLVCSVLFVVVAVVGLRLTSKIHEDYERHMVQVFAAVFGFSGLIPLGFGIYALLMVARAPAVMVLRCITG